MAAMTNLENTMQANAVATMQAVERMGQPMGNGNRNGNKNGNGEGDGNNLRGIPMTLASFLKVIHQLLEGRPTLLKQKIGSKQWSMSLRKARELELMQLNQGSLSVADYISQFGELCRFSRVCQGAPESYESWQCIKYQGRLRDNIMMAVAPLEIRCAKKVALARDPRGGNNNRGRGKYFQPRGQNFKRGGHIPQHPLGQGGFRRNNYDQYHQAKGRGKQSKTSPDSICNSCGHFPPYDSCKLGIGEYFTCRFPGHMAKDCPCGRNLNAGQNQQGRVFAVNASDDTKVDPLMRGNYLFGEKILVLLYDTEASHSFIAFDKVKKLGLKMSKLAFDLHVHTPYQTVVTRSGCRELSKNRVLLDCFEQLIRFMPEGEGGAVVAEGDEQKLDQISAVGDFLEVFPEDIPKFLSQKEIEFAIDLVPRVGPVSMAPY
ncbi:uncharacterized protein LOC107607304 [Arachis ipaensis]|uniref:uncharacterized protein LOC107607304 n=1 Tax=Arachis ipaensis TaxID=130454 RepID=UPI0007AF5833|nr:uncharacterized protein LOC107607304 [Arachis ipaensis]